MNVYELNEEQLDELRERFYIELQNNNEHVPYSNDDIHDWILYHEYKDIDFVDDDFWCTAGPGSEKYI